MLFIDANLHRPELHTRFGLYSGPGLSDALDGRKHWLQCIHRGVATRVDLLEAGDHYYAPGDLLSGPRMQALLEDTCSTYDIVVLDLPSTEESPDVECLGPHLDATLLLCCEGVGPSRRTVERTVERLERTGTNVVGLLRRPRASTRDRVARLRAELSMGAPYASEPDEVSPIDVVEELDELEALVLNFDEDDRSAA